MRRSRPSADRPSEDGSASVEFLALGLLLLVPTVYLIVALASIQSASFAAEGAARAAVRAYSLAQTEESGAEAAQLSLAAALDDRGLADDSGAIRLRCMPIPSACLTRGGLIAAEVEIRIALPLAPAALDLDAPLAVTVRAEAAQRVSDFAVVGG